MWESWGTHVAENRGILLGEPSWRLTGHLPTSTSHGTLLTAPNLRAPPPATAGRSHIHESQHEKSALSSTPQKPTR